MVVICSSCNGSFEKSKAACPFCGTLYYPGAEQQYLEELDDIVEDFQDVLQQPQKQIREETLKSTQKLGRIFLVCITVALIFGVIFTVSLSQIRKPSQTEEEKKAQMLWEKEHFPQLDIWYESGDYEAILDFSNQLDEDENNPYYLYMWEPMMFLYKYAEHKMFLEIQEIFDATGTISEENLGKLLISTLDDTLFYLYSAEEQLIVTEYFKKQHDFLVVESFFTGEELMEIKEKSLISGEFDRDVCYKTAKERWTERYV